MDRHRRSASLFRQQFSTRFPSTSLDSQSHSICTHMVRIACAACVGAGVFTGQWFSGNQPACFSFFLIIPRQVCMVQHLHIVHNTCCLTILSSILESKLLPDLTLVQLSGRGQERQPTKNQLDEAKSRRSSGTETEHAMCASCALYTKMSCNALVKMDSKSNFQFDSNNHHQIRVGRNVNAVSAVEVTG